MTKKKHLVFRCDGKGAANNARRCNEWARGMGLGRSFEVRPTGPRSNYVQEYGVYVTDAGLKKVKAIRARREAEEHEWRQLR